MMSKHANAQSSSLLCAAARGQNITTIEIACEHYHLYRVRTYMLMLGPIAAAQNMLEDRALS